VSTDAERTNGTVTRGGRVLPSDLMVGDCFTLPEGDRVLTVTVLPRAEAHDAEVYAAFDLDPGPDPGERFVTGATGSLRG
jgi:hypothetical protein